jgi:hypothetical protein
VFASFFFWKPSLSKLPKSLNGLMRSLLHDILLSSPELTCILFPNQWHQLLLAPAHLRLGEDVTFRDDEIHKAFAELMKHQETYKTHRFCFFIDGLDEYEETPQADCKAMVELLHAWTQVSLDNVKLCVSSREYNVFLNNFHAEKRIRLQDLTMMDMERYVRALLSDLEGKEEKEQLVTEILDRSDGIFLWVALVVKDLRERLEDDYSFLELRKELASLPQELEALFSHLLASIRVSSRTTAYLIFSMVHRLETYSFKLPLHTCSFLDDYQKDPLFAFQADLSCVKWDATRLSIRNARTRKKINGHCRGLVDIVEFSDFGDQEWYLAFTHRSILEFLQEPSFQHEMETQLRGVVIEDIVSQILFADIQCRDDSCLNDRVLGRYVYAIISMRTRLNLDLPPYNYLFNLNLVVAEKTGGVEVHELISQCSKCYSCVSSAGNYVSLEDPESVLTSPFYLSACCGNPNFVTWMLTNKYTVEDQLARAFLINCLSWRTKQREAREAQQGVVPLNLMKSLVDRFGLSCTMRSDPAMTLAWTSFVASMMGLIPRSCFHLSALPLFGELFASFLRAGADPRVSFIFQRSYSVPILTERLGSPTISLFFNIQFGTSKRSTKDHHCFCDERFTLLFDSDKRLSFRDVVRYWNLSNEKEIIDLIDERTKLYDSELDENELDESEWDDEQDTEGSQQLLIDAPHDRETAGPDVLTLTESNSPPEDLEAKAVVVASTLDATPQGWYPFSGFGYVGIILMGTYSVLPLLTMPIIPPTLAICNVYYTAS